MSDGYRITRISALTFQANTKLFRNSVRGNLEARQMWESVKQDPFTLFACLSSPDTPTEYFAREAVTQALNRKRL